MPGRPLRAYAGVVARARIPDEQGRAAVLAAAPDPAAVPREVRATAVRYTLQALAERAPGHAVEVRVPPFGAVQCVEGPRHTRGTPPNVVETDPASWLALAVGELDWATAVAEGRVHVSGVRAELAPWLPLLRTAGTMEG